MFDLLRDLSDWLVGFADSDWAVLILAISSFSEAIFFPIPPDPLLIGMGVTNPDQAIWLAALVTLTSVAGAFVGHLLGKRLGRPIVQRFIDQKKIDAVDRMFSRYGAWAILIAAFSPLPFKVFTVSAGILDLDRRTLLIASVVGRGARFFLIGTLIFVFGEEIEEFIDSNLELLAVAATGVLVVGLGAAWLFVRHRRAKNAMDPEI